MNQLNRYYLMHGKPRVKAMPMSINATDARDDDWWLFMLVVAFSVAAYLLAEQGYAYIVRPAPVALVMTPQLECREELAGGRKAQTRDEAFGLCKAKNVTLAD
jgi:hypothetical protein